MLTKGKYAGTLHFYQYVKVFKTKLKTLLFKEYYKKKGVCG